MSKFKKLLLIFPVILVLLIPYTSFSVSAIKDFVFAVSEPPVDSYHGYIVIPYYNSQLNHYQASMLYWVITPTVKTDNDTAPVVTLDYQPENYRFQLQFMTAQSDVSYTVAVYNTVGVLANSTSTGGNTYCSGVKVISYSSSPTFSTSFGPSILFYNPIFQGVTFLDQDDFAPSSLGSASIIWGDDSAIYEELYNVNNKLFDLINSLDFTNEQLEQIYDLLSEYLNNIYLIDRSIEDTLTWFYDEFFWWSYEVQGNQERIIELLENLVEGTEEFTESSTLSDEQNELNRVENELLNNESASSAQEDIKIEVNGNAMSYIWDLITQFLNSNSKIMGMVITILSLGIIALILNR